MVMTLLPLTRRLSLMPTFGRALVLAGLVGFSGLASAQPREVRVGVYQNEPKIFLSDNGQPTGILGDLLAAMAAREGWTLRAVPCEWQACLDALQAGQIDLMPDVAYNAQRAELFDVHPTPALLSWSQVYRHRGTPINSALDLQGKRIAVLAGSVQQTYLENLMAGFGLKAELVPVKSFNEGFALAASGEVDGAAVNRFFGDLQGDKFDLEPTPVLFLPSQLFYATGKGQNADLLATIDRNLREWQAQPDSDYFKVLSRWMEAPPQFVVPAYVSWGLGGLGLLLALAVGAGAWLRREVAAKTRHLKASEDKLNTILDSVEAYIYIKDPQLRYQYANRKVCELFGQPLAQVIGKTDADFFDAATAENLRLNDRQVFSNDARLEEEETNRTADGATTQTFLSIKLPLHRPDGSAYALCGISTDITRHKQAEEAIHQLAYYDPLTQLPNRRFLMERLQQTLAASERSHAGGALLFIDVDNFKDLNDTLGHAMGDQLLCQMASRLSTCTRAQDTLARLGGDEFVVMLQGLSPQKDEAVQQARQVAQKILAQVSAPYPLQTQTYQTSVSIGIALFSGPNVSRDELLKQADLAMYRAKSDGRNTLRFFNTDMQAQVTARMALETDLHRALAASEFMLFYQPQVDSGGHCLGVEALVRWQHPQRGLVPPAEFIPLAEASGLILPLGRWILHEACRQLVVWSHTPDRAHHTIAVNVSARQFRQADFVQQVQMVLQDTGANPQRLELELTESQLLDDVDGVITKMEALKAMGVRFSLDDFGTGYSSLSMLKRLPLDQLKIDQSFVRDVLTDAQDASIIKAILSLGNSLELAVIAEGVETQAHRDALLQLGCHKFQGYFFGRPAPASR